MHDRTLPTYPTLPCHRWSRFAQQLSSFALIIGVAAGCQDEQVFSMRLAHVSDSTCPAGVIVECGSVTRCTAIDPNSGFAEDLIIGLGGNAYDWDCEAGKGAAIDAITMGKAYLVHNFGGCTTASGFHDYDNGHVIGIKAGLSQGVRVKAMWHEGWSRANQCEDADCHNEGWLETMEGQCYN